MKSPRSANEPNPTPPRPHTFSPPSFAPLFGPSGRTVEVNHISTIRSLVCTEGQARNEQDDEHSPLPLDSSWLFELGFPPQNGVRGGLSLLEDVSLSRIDERLATSSWGSGSDGVEGEDGEEDGGEEKEETHCESERKRTVVGDGEGCCGR